MSGHQRWPSARRRERLQDHTWLLSNCRRPACACPEPAPIGRAVMVTLRLARGAGAQGGLPWPTPHRRIVRRLTPQAARLDARKASRGPDHASGLGRRTASPPRIADGHCLHRGSQSPKSAAYLAAGCAEVRTGAKWPSGEAAAWSLQGVPRTYRVYPHG
jgi:hypothetical protein